jgi:hypothetical protein
MRRNSSVPGCGASSRGLRGSQADRIRKGKKSFCCVTTRGRKLRLLNRLSCRLCSLAALSLSLGMLGFGIGALATFGLPPCRLPAADLPQAFRLLAVALAPTSWPILAPASFAETNPRARLADSGQTAVF